jgi:hypothetical protein
LIPDEDRENVIKYFIQILNTEYPNDRACIPYPIFLCNSISHFCPSTFTFELVMKDKISVGIKIISEEENVILSIDDFKLLTKNLFFIFLYIPEDKLGALIDYL